MDGARAGRRPPRVLEHAAARRQQLQRGAARRRLFPALRGYGRHLGAARLGKWPSAAERDFLLGSLDEYATLVAADLATLRATLDRAHAAGLKVVVTPLSLPGARCEAAERRKFDDRLWSDKKYWRQSAAFWRDLAGGAEGSPGRRGLQPDQRAGSGAQGRTRRRGARRTSPEPGRRRSPVPRAICRRSTAR